MRPHKRGVANLEQLLPTEATGRQPVQAIPACTLACPRPRRGAALPGGGNELASGVLRSCGTRSDPDDDTWIVGDSSERVATCYGLQPVP